MKDPYSTEHSVALVIARKLLNEIVKRNSNHKLPYDGEFLLRSIAREHSAPV